MVNTTLIKQFVLRYAQSHKIKAIADVPLYKAYGVLLVAENGQDKHTLGFLFNDVKYVYHVKAYVFQYINVVHYAHNV